MTDYEQIFKDYQDAYVKEKELMKKYKDNNGDMIGMDVLQTTVSAYAAHRAMLNDISLAMSFMSHYINPNKITVSYTNKLTKEQKEINNKKCMTCKFFALSKDNSIGVCYNKKMSYESVGNSVGDDYYFTKSFDSLLGRHVYIWQKRNSDQLACKHYIVRGRIESDG